MVEVELNRMLALGVLEPSTSAWASPLVLIPKKDGTARFCIDYRRLNQATKKDAYPLPRIDDTLELMRGSVCFCTLDLASGYWQLELAAEDREKTAVITHKGLFQFTVLPFGLCNAPSTFKRFMDNLLGALVGRVCLVYIDDVIVFGNSEEQCLENLDVVLGAIQSSGLKLKASKCHMMQREVNFLGHVVSEKGISTDPEKVKVVNLWPLPETETAVRAFFGFAGYYRSFVQDFATLAAPLYALTQKGVSFEWTKECQRVFIELKETLASAPVLAFPAELGSLVLDTDASDYGLGVVLSQQQADGTERVLSFASRALSKPERNYCVTRKELLAIVYAVRKYRHYLGRKIIVRTDHNALQWLFSFREPEGQMARWLVELSAYNLIIRHRPGKTHGNADGLSRIPCKQCGMPAEVKEITPSVGMVCPVLSQTPDNKDVCPVQRVRQRTVKNLQQAVPKMTEVTQSLERGVNIPVACWEGPGELAKLRREESRLKVSRGILGRDWVSPNGTTHWQPFIPVALRRECLYHAHDGPVAAHLGAAKTLSGLRKIGFWPGCTKDVDLYVRSCQVCQSKQRRPRPVDRALLRPVVPGYPWQRFQIDFMGPLPRTRRGNKYVLVVVDPFTKWAEAFPTTRITAKCAADVLVREVILRFGTPEIIQTDQGSAFDSKLFRSVCVLLGIHKTRTTPYHPQADGVVERLNRTLESMLTATVKTDQTDWDLQLPFVSAAYRSTKHATTGFSPNYLVLGR